MLRMRTLAPLLIAPLLAVTACSSDSSVDPGPYIDAVEEDLASSDGLTIDDEDNRCVAEAIVDAADPDRLDEAGVSPEDLAEAESFDDVDVEFDDEELRESLTASLGDCSLGDALTEVFVAEFPFELSDDDLGCISGSLDEGEELRAGLADSLIDGSDEGIQTAFSASLVDCPAVTGEILAQAIGQAGVTVSDEAKTCITGEMEARGEAAVEQLIAGGAAAQGLGEEIGEACLSELTG